MNDLEIPTIGVLNGPGFHTEICLMCDITICSEDAIIFDLHYDIGSVPGDGIHSCFLELLGREARQPMRCSRARPLTQRKLWSMDW